MWKRGEIAPLFHILLFSTIFSVYLYFQESNYIFICEMWLFDLSFFLNSANLICRDTDIWKYFRESLGLRDNESRLYDVSFVIVCSSSLPRLVIRDGCASCLLYFESRSVYDTTQARYGAAPQCIGVGL